MSLDDCYFVLTCPWPCNYPFDVWELDLFSVVDALAHLGVLKEEGFGNYRSVVAESIKDDKRISETKMLQIMQSVQAVFRPDQINTDL